MDLSSIARLFLDIIREETSRTVVTIGSMVATWDGTSWIVQGVSWDAIHQLRWMSQDSGAEFRCWDSA